MILEELPQIVESALFAANVDFPNLKKHVDAYEDAEHLRNRLSDLGLIAFVADGAILPRVSGAP
jgi:predicted ABC-class ATPase